MSRSRPLAASLFALTILLASAEISAPASAAAAPAQLTSFVFRTTLDATPVGGSSVTPMRIIYQFRPDLAPGTGPLDSSTDGTTVASYGPVEQMILEVGRECVAMSGTGTGITVFDDAGTTFVEDSYDVRAQGAAVAGKQLFRRNLRVARFLLVDPAAMMFGDTALPTSPMFADDADSQQTLVEFVDANNRRTQLNAGDAPFSLGTFEPQAEIGAILDDVRALPVAGDIIAKLSAPLERAKTLMGGVLTQKNVDKSRGELDAFIKVVHTNRNKLGEDAAASLEASALNVIGTFPGCA